VGGLSVKERMAMLASSGQPGGPAGAPKGGPVGASLKQRMASLAQNGMKEDPAAAKAKAEVEQERLTAEAFRSSTFYYGTTGGTSVLKMFLDTLTAKLTAKLQANLAAQGKKDDWASVYYWPGERANQYLADRDGRSAFAATPGAQKTASTRAYPASPKVDAVAGRGEPVQMMDMFYGGEHHNLGQLRNPQIGKYVHEKMGYKGDYDQAKSGRDAYMDTYSVGQFAGLEGWQYPQLPKGSPANKDTTMNDYSKALFTNPETKEPLSGTMEISRYIRDGIKKYGGTLIFENKNVYNEGSFLTGVRQGDTNKEAVELLPVLAGSPGKSRVPFGAGTLVFQYEGKETVPTQWLFRQFWAFRQPPLSAEAANTVIPATSHFWAFPRGAALKLAGERVMEGNRKIKAASQPPAKP
jgi:hypothetical protein